MGARISVLLDSENGKTRRRPVRVRGIVSNISLLCSHDRYLIFLVIVGFISVDRDHACSGTSALIR